MAYDIILGRDPADKAKFGDKGIIYLGKGYVKMGQYTSLSNKIWMDIARTHVVMIAGKRGSGKCLHEDTLITLANGTQIPIKDLENNKEKIISLNEKLKIEQAEKSDFFSRKTNRLLKIKLRSGKEIKLTPEHPLLTIKGWEEAQKLGIGSRIATPRKIPILGDKETPENKIKILAYLIAEGHLSNGFCLFSNYDEKINNEFKEAINLFDNNLRIDTHSKFGCFRISQKKKKYTIKEFKRNSKGQFIDNNIIYEKSSLIKWLSDLGIYGKLSAQKFVPEIINKLNKEKLSIFLNRLFSCDGSIYKKKTQNGATWQISYASSSEKMIRQIQNLLLRFEILSKLREKTIKLNDKRFKSFELVLGSDNVTKFIDNIGFFGKKEERQIIAKNELSNIKLNPNVDTVPKEVWQMYKPQNWTEIGRQLGYAHPKAMRERVHYSPSRQTLMQIANVEQSNPLKLLAESDIFWDEIISLELLEGEFTVYDICVPTNHNFVANDIIVHNSYSLGVIAEELSNLPTESSSNIASLIFDTMGIFWTMKFENEKEKSLLDSWELKTKKCPVKVFIPFGKIEAYQKQGIPFDETFALKASELNAEDWLSVFGLEFTSLPAVLIERALSRIKESKSDFNLKDIQTEISKDTKSTPETKIQAESLFQAAESWGIFAKEGGTEIKDLITAGITSILDTSVYSSIGSFNVRALVISLVCRKIFTSRVDARKKEEISSIQHGQDYLSYKNTRDDPLVWIFVDECHEFLPRIGKTPATDALIQLLREGRQPGISLVMATQQPGQIHMDAMTQSDIVIAHRVTARPDIEALNEIMQTYLLENIKQAIDDLPSLKGSAIVLDDNSERIYPIRVRPRYTWHGGEAPSAVKTEINL